MAQGRRIPGRFIHIGSSYWYSHVHSISLGPERKLFSSPFWPAIVGTLQGVLKLMGPGFNVNPDMSFPAEGRNLEQRVTGFQSKQFAFIMSRLKW